jgi:flagellar motor switch protein FliM
MASAVTSPAQQQQLQQKSMQEGSASELAMVPIDSVSEEDPIDLTMPVSRLPVELEIAVPVREFRVRNLVGLDRGQVIATKWEQSDDLPLSAGEVQLAWTEFEVVDAQLAVRVTRLA